MIDEYQYYIMMNIYCIIACIEIYSMINSLFSREKFTFINIEYSCYTLISTSSN